MLRSKTRAAAMILGLALGFSLAAPDAWAQKKKKNGEKEPTEPTFTLADPQQLEKNIGEMLAAWQIGDLALLQKYYASDVMVVSGAYEPPLQGWANYAQAYQRQRERIQGVRIERRNTFVQVKGPLAYAAYQWEMEAIADGNPFGARGHTTLTFEKRGGAWLIILNHTSMVETAQQKPASQPPPAPGTPPPAKN